KPEIVVQPRDIEISYGQTAVFSCKTSGDPRPEIVWLFEESALRSESSDGRVTLLPDGSLRIDETVPADGGQYVCIARNSLGESRSRTAHLTVNNDVVESEAEAPKFLRTPTDPLELLEGDPIVLDCVVTGAPTPSILWKFNNENIQNGRIKLFGNGSLILPVSTLDDGGIYTCCAGNALGNISVNVTVQVNGTSVSRLWSALIPDIQTPAVYPSLAVYPDELPDVAHHLWDKSTPMLGAALRLTSLSSGDNHVTKTTFWSEIGGIPVRQ
uniref:Ig-like domain-containing protein n=1 Tax=Anopheles maculatus TaxID=74869 RepID=A0A182SSC9_9DIPT